MDSKQKNPTPFKGGSVKAQNFLSSGKPTISFIVKGRPHPQQRPRFFRKGNFVGTYSPNSNKDAESNFLAQAVKFAPDKPIEGAVVVEMVFSFLKPKSKAKKVKHIITRPDLSNYIKQVEDTINKIFICDDSQIVDIHAKKVYGISEHTSIRITELED